MVWLHHGPECARPRQFFYLAAALFFLSNSPLTKQKETIDHA
jgi:hypothetical protein